MTSHSTTVSFTGMAPALVSLPRVRKNRDYQGDLLDLFLRIQSWIQPLQIVRDSGNSVSSLFNFGLLDPDAVEKICFGK